jgi:hypothetical protein
MTVSMRSARPSFMYCLIRECLQKAFRVTAVACRSIAVLNTPPAFAPRGLRLKTSSVRSGPPMSRLSATSASKKARVWRGAVKTRVRETST